MTANANHELNATVDVVDVPCEEAHPGRPFCGWKHQKEGEKHYYFNGHEITPAEFNELLVRMRPEGGL